VSPLTFTIVLFPVTVVEANILAGVPLSAWAIESGAMPVSMSKLDELALKKVAAKETEDFKRAASKIGGLRHTEFNFTDAGLILQNQKIRGCISDIPGEVIPPRE
jgi:hypothetical protein